MHFLRLLSASCCLAATLSSGSALAAARIAAPEARTTARNRASVELIDVDALIRSFKIPSSAGTLQAVTADAKGTNIGMVFVDKTLKYSVYRNGKALVTGRPLGFAAIPDTFPAVLRFTRDGKLLHAVTPSELYVDAQRITRDGNSFSYYSGADDTVTEDDGMLYFAETDAIRSHHLASGMTETLFAHPGSRVAYLRAVNGNFYYTLQESDDQAYLYRNGKQLYGTAVSNGANFLVTQEEDVYFFSEDGERYRLLRNGQASFQGNGFSGFLFEDLNGDAWHAGYVQEQAEEALPFYGKMRNTVSLYRNAKPVSMEPLANMEGAIEFSGTRFAFRAAPQSSPLEFYLYVNGKRMGSAFSFTGKRDTHGILLTAGGKAYMRNYDAGHWKLYENGRPILTDRIRDVWFLGFDPKRVTAYVTKK